MMYKSHKILPVKFNQFEKQAIKPALFENNITP